MKEKRPKKSENAKEKRSKKSDNEDNESKKSNSDNEVDKQSDVEMKSVDDEKEDRRLNDSSFRRSSRKRKSRFDFKELVDSDDEDSDFEDVKPKGKKSTAKVSKKQMKAKIKEFIGSSDSDDYKPTDDSESDAVSEELEEENDSDFDGNDSDISDVLPNTNRNNRGNNSFKPIKSSKYFNKSSFSSKSKNNQGLVAYRASNSSRLGCYALKSENSIGIETLGNPQDNLLKSKISNFRVAPTSQTAAEQNSAFGNGSCVVKLLDDHSVTKHYERYKKQYMDLKTSKNDEKVDSKDLLKILTEFESGITSKPSAASTSKEVKEEPKATKGKSSKKATKKVKNEESDTDDDDFEEVENAEMAEDFDDYKPGEFIHEFLIIINIF